MSVIHSSSSPYLNELEAKVMLPAAVVSALPFGLLMAEVLSTHRSQHLHAMQSNMHHTKSYRDGDYLWLQLTFTSASTERLLTLFAFAP